LISSVILDKAIDDALRTVDKTVSHVDVSLKDHWPASLQLDNFFKRMVSKSKARVPVEMV
jgi:hypothetical protein